MREYGLNRVNHAVSEFVSKNTKLLRLDLHLFEVLFDCNCKFASPTLMRVLSTIAGAIELYFNF